MAAAERLTESGHRTWAHGNDDVLASFAVGFAYAQQQPIFVQPELSCLTDGKQGRVFFVFSPDAEDQAVGLKSVACQQFPSFCADRQCRESGDGVAGLSRTADEPSWQTPFRRACLCFAHTMQRVLLEPKCVS